MDNNENEEKIKRQKQIQIRIGREDKGMHTSRQIDQTADSQL